MIKYKMAIWFVQTVMLDCMANAVQESTTERKTRRMNMPQMSTNICCRLYVSETVNDSFLSCIIYINVDGNVHCTIIQLYCEYKQKNRKTENKIATTVLLY